MSDLYEQYTREEIDPMKLYDTHGEKGLHTTREEQYYDALKQRQNLKGDDVWDSISSYTGTDRAVPSSTQRIINYDHGFWADVSDELGLWWHGLVLDDNEFTDTWLQGTKQWWQQDPDMEFNPYLEDDGYEKYRHLWKNVRTRDHFEYLKAKIDNHLASRARLEETDRQFGPALMAGVFDPINFIALPYVKGLGLAAKFIKGGAVVGGSVAATEFIRRPLDPTSTAEESAFYIGGAFLLGGGLTAAIGGRGFRGAVNKNNNEPDLRNMSEPDIQVENMNKVDHTESGLHTVDRELDAHTNNHLIYSPKDYEPHMELVEGPITTNKNKYVPTERDNNLIEINNVFKDVYEKLRESDIGRKTKTFSDLSQRTPRFVVKTAPEVMDEHMRMGQLFSTREGQLELAKALKNKGLLKEYRNIINEQNNVQPSFKGFNFKKLGFNKVEEARFKHIMGNHVKQGKAIRKELHELDAIDKKLDDPNFLRKAESWSEAFTDKNIAIPRYMEKQIDQMSNEPLSKFREELIPDAPDTVRLEKDLGIEIQKLRDFIATLKAKKTDELNTLYSHGTITDKTMDDFYAFEQTKDAIGEIDKITSEKFETAPGLRGTGETVEEYNKRIAEEGVDTNLRDDVIYKNPETMEDSGINTLADAIKAGKKIQVTIPNVKKYHVGQRLDVEGTQIEVVHISKKTLGQELKEKIITEEKWSKAEALITNYIPWNPEILKHYRMKFIVIDPKQSDLLTADKTLWAARKTKAKSVAKEDIVKKWTKEEIMEQEMRAFDSPEKTMQNNFDNLTGVQRFVKAIQEQVQQITKLTNTTSNTRGRFVKYNPRTGVMQRDTGSIKVIYDNKEYLKPDGKGVNPLPAGEFRNWLDYLDFRTHKEILRQTRFRKDELVIDTPINIVTKSKKREGGGVKHAWFDKNKQEINVNKQAILDDFKNKPWTVAKTKGVKPYPEEQFKTPDEWYDFVLKHEKMHTLHKRKKNESVGEYENRINELALHRPNPIFKTTAEYQNALNKKTLDDLRENKFKDYSEDIPMWATEISQFQSQYGWLINLQKKFPNMKTTPIIGSMITRLAGTHGVPMRMARHGLIAPPSALVRINTEFAAKFREVVEAIDNAYVRVNMSNKDPMNWMGFNVSKASLVARDVFRNKVVNPALEKAGKDKQKARVVTEDQVNEAIGKGVIDPEFRAKLPKELHEAIDAIINYNKFIDGIFKKHKAYVSAGGYEKVLLNKENRSIEIGNIIRSNNARTTNKIPEEAINELKIKKAKLDEQVKQLKETHERYVKDQEKRKKAGLHNPEDFEDFFPRVWNLTKVMQDEEGLRKILFEHYSENQKLLRPYTKIDKTTGEITQIEKVADMEGYAGVVWYEKLPGKKPERKFLSKKDEKYADKIEELKSKEIKFKEVKKKPGEEILEAKAAGQAQMPGLKARIEKQINEDMETIIRQAEDGESLNVGGLGIDNFGKYVSGTTTLMSRKINIPNKKIMDYLQLDAKVTMNNYRQKVAPAAAIMDAFGSHHMDDALDVLEIEMLAQDLGRNMTKQDVDDVITSFVDIKDKMMGMYNLENASSLNKRIANFLGNWAQLAMMGKVAFAALPDIGKMIMSQGLNKTFSKGFGGYFKYTDEQLKAVKNLRQMGIGTDIVLGQTKRRYVEDTGTTMWGGPTSNWAEKVFNKVGQKFDDWVGPYYLLNGLAFHTTFHKEVTGIMAADNIIRLSIKTAGGKATKEDIKTLAHHMIDEDTAKIIAKMPYEKVGADLGNIPGVGKRALETKTILGTVDDDVLYTANVREWTGPGSEAARTRFRNAVWGETNRSIVTPDVSDTPSLMHGGMRIRDPGVRKELEGSEFGKFIGYRPDERGGKIHNAMLARPFQFFSWGMAANRKIVMSGLSGREADYISGAIAMVSLGYIADYLKNPRYHAHKSTEEKIIRAVELSGIGGMITDMNFLTEQITGGLFNYPMGLRPLIGVEPRFGQPKAHDALGEFVGAGPSIPIDILYHMFGDDVTYEQRQNLSRRLIPGATLAWTDGLFKKIYNSTTDAIFR